MNSTKNAKMMDKYGDLSGLGIFIEKKTFDSYSWPLHWHNCWELEIVLSGSGKQILNGTEYDICPGTVYVLNPTDFHEISFENVTVYNISFPDEMLPADFTQYFSGIGGGLIKTLDGEQFKNFRQICDILYYESTNPQKHGEKSCKLLLELIMIHLLRIFDVKQPSKNDSKKALIGSAVSYVNIHFRENPTLSDTAAYLGITPNYLSEEFHAATGKKYKEYLNEVRLMYAKRLLSSSSLSITEICFASGFSSLSNFLRVFKAHFGVSPQALKNSL
ncbi:MAG: helix-turn-helix domain-containing protein [Clostridia bacterium]|nr:helix-turn-helix domain-containing protein [Clostridia bacterium]